MLFNSHEFIFIFFPLVLLFFYLIQGKFLKFSLSVLSLASLIFYGIWNPHSLWILLLSIVFNYFSGNIISKESSAVKKRKNILIFSVLLNIIALGYFKYFNFFAENISTVFNYKATFEKVMLPIGISFFTFTQIAFLVDCFKGKATERNFIQYLLFVTYFPHLIAGPILHHKEIIPQFQNPHISKVNYKNLVIGIAFFTIGLFKKVIIADYFIETIGKVFEGATKNNVSFLDAWIGVLSYTFQLYFDFSGYCDMAIGVSKMFNIDLPLNFNSPNKAKTIIDFWRRWHITLSNFLRDYLYISLGGNRKGTFKRYLNLFITMLIGGFWHGAGWTFIVGGALHGFYLIINHT